MALDNKTIFVSGSTGMVGSSILRQIIENCPTLGVRACRHTTEPVVKDRRIEYIRGDLRLLDDCRKMVRGADCVVMAAGYGGGVKNTNSFPWQKINENLALNKQMLEAASLEGVKRVIFIGSATLYQEFTGSIREQDLDWNKDPHGAHFAFGWTMRYIEKLCMFLNKRFGIEIIVVRAGNIFGPFDKFDPETSNFIPALIRKAVDKMEPFEVWGSADVTRDVLYSDDLARAIIMIMNMDAASYDVFNLGSGVATKVGDVVRWALKFARHTPADIRYIQDKPTTIKSRVLDCSKIKNSLGWQPKYSVEEGIRDTLQWWMENKRGWKK